MSKPQKKPAQAEADFAPTEAWGRFERAVDIALQTKPMHREPVKKKVAKKKAKR